MVEHNAPERRFRVERPLGEGGMGTVVAAWDSVLGRRVAIKRTSRAGASDLLRFKREFRAIEKLRHPNLVRVYELGEDEHGLYFTMEAVDGADLAAHCAGTNKLARLEGLLPQLAAALAFLHANGVVHCDLKPSNALVDGSGTLKLLDFGVLAELSRPAAHIGGTPAYLAPERIRGEPATPAADAYALGCTLFEIVAGRTPFSGPTDRMLAAHVNEPPPSLRDVAPDVTAELDALCESLLAKRPEERPSMGAIVRASPARAVPAVIGRSELEAELSAWATADEPPRILVLRGPTGVGKSTLLESMCARAQASGRLVLRSAARATERLAYNALDAAMDDLAQVLMTAGPASPRALRVAAEAFPVLRTPWHSADEARETLRMRLFGWRDSLESYSRREIFDAIAQLVVAAAPRGALVAVDDFQWADADSVALARHLVEKTGAEIRVALVVRDDVEPGLADAWLASELEVLAVEVPPLDERAIAELVRAVAEGLGARVSDDAVASAARACHGRPFLAELEGRSLARGSATIEGALDEDRDLLAVLVASDGWTKVSALAGVLGRSLGVIDDALGHLASEGVVRRTWGAGDERVDLYHDGVRTKVLERLGDGERSAGHARIAEHLLQTGGAGPALVRHLLACGRDASEAARHAGEAAERQRAFGLAADMYDVVLSAAPGDRALRERRAKVLERAGRYLDAAGEWRELASAAPPDQAIELHLDEAHALIAASRTVEGTRRLESALAESGRAGVHVRGLRALGAIARFAIGPVELRSARRPATEEGVERAGRHLKIGILLAFLDPLAGIHFLHTVRAGAASAGAAAHVAGCDYLFGILALAASPRAGRVALSERYERAAEARAEGHVLPPDVRGMRPFLSGVRAMREGRWAEADARFAEAIELFRDSAGTTEHAIARSFRMMMYAHKQDHAACRRETDWFRRHAEECGGTLLSAHLGLVEGYSCLLEGRFDDTYATLTSTAGLFEEERPNAQRAAKLIYRHLADIYREPRRARAELAQDLERAKQFRFMQTMYAGVYASLAAVIEANALRVRDPLASARRVEKLARIADRAPPLAAGGAWRARAYAADAMGRPEQALADLARAEVEAVRYDRIVDGAIARWQRGRRLGGDEGAALCQRAHDDVVAHGASPRVLEEDAGRR